MKRSSLPNIILGIILLTLISLGGYYLIQNQSNSVVYETGVIRAGYIIYPPLMSQDTDGELVGVSYDIAEAVASELGLEIEWTEEVGWGTALEGLNTNRYDVLGTQMWPNEQREAVAQFSVAPMDSVIYPYVATDEDRFSGDDLEALNSESVTISTLDGEMAVFIAEEDYPEASVNALPQLSSYAEVFLNIVQGKADVTFVEPSAAADFLDNNPGSIMRLGDMPVRSFGNSFAFRKSDDVLVRDWNRAVEVLVEDGIIMDILDKYGVGDYYQVN
jgi:ABC-type amino acid transport substrate-binding protein